MRSPSAGTLIILLACSSSTVAAGDRLFDIDITHRVLYGPGPSADQELGTGYVRSMKFNAFMAALVAASNNGGQSPNVSGEDRQGTEVDGKLSDGTRINENIDMGNAVIINGQFNLLLAAVYDGPNKGDSHFFLDEDFNWTIRDDIAMDPGFPEGIVKLDNFTFSTGPRAVPFSLQTAGKFPGGVDRVGSLKSGDVVIGRVGDDDADGRVDGVFFAMGALPLSSPFLPGAPFVQRIEFTSDIPVESTDAALLTLASARNCQRMLKSPPEGTLMERGAPVLTQCLQERAALAAKHLVRAKAECRSKCEVIATAAEAMRDSSASLDRVFDQLLTLRGHKSGKALALTQK